MGRHQATADLFRFDQSDALLRKVMESAAVGMTLVGADGRTIYANHAFEAMLGYAPDACLGLSMDSMIHSADLHAVMLRFDQLMRGEIADFGIDCRMSHMDGTPLWVHATASLLRSEHTGAPLYVIAQLTNIDAQKRAEEALASTERRWNAALEAAGQGVWDHDIRTDKMFYSRMWRTMRGFAPDEEVDGSQEA